MTTTPRAPSHAERCRTLAVRARQGALASVHAGARDPSTVGFPYASLVATAVDGAGRPILLLSSLAEHTQNLIARSEASLLLWEPAPAGVDPLAQGRVTILGACARLDGAEVEAASAAFLEAHPEAASYSQFRDFSFYRMEPASLRYVGGFGRMSWVTAADYAQAEPDPLADAVEGICAHMNDDHGKACLDYARGLAGIAAAEQAAMVSVDRYGFELRVSEPGQPDRIVRLAFDDEVITPDACGWRW